MKTYETINKIFKKDMSDDELKQIASKFEKTQFPVDLLEVMIQHNKINKFGMY